MPRDARKDLIEQIEALRGNRLVVYVTSDRTPVPGQMGDDAVRPLYDHLRALGRVPNLDLLIYSRGGASDVPWRIATALRAISDSWNILVPFRANSAATLLALGADDIILGAQGELGPIDPILPIQKQVMQPNGVAVLVQENVSVEDVMAYGRFAKERAGISDQAALSQSLNKLTDRLDAVVLGNAYRTHTHIREVARRLLLSRRGQRSSARGRVTTLSEQAISTIIETLAERVYAHGHAIGFREAHDIGLPVTQAAPNLDALMWSLLGEYEADLSLLQPFDPFDAARASATGTHREPWPQAIIESSWGAHEYRGELEVTAKRQMPQNVTINVNLPLTLPAGVNVAQLPQQIQQLLQGIVQAATVAAQQAAQQALQQQAPLIGVDAFVRGAAWTRTA